MAYTFGGFKPATSPDNFSGLRTDGNRVSMTGALANYMQSKDATDTPVYSPLSNGSNAGFTLTVPKGAVRFNINASVTTQVGEDSTYAYGFTVPANTIYTFDCANMANIYVKPSNAVNTINFYFDIV